MSATRKSTRVRTEAPFYPVEGEVEHVVRTHAEQAVKALDYWKRISDAKKIKVPSGSRQLDYSIKRELSVARRIGVVARAFLKSTKAGMDAWLKNATQVQEFFGYASRTMDDRDFQDPAVSVLHKAWSRVTDGSLAAAMKAKRNPKKRNPSPRSQFDAAYRAHRAWTTRRIPFKEYDTATRGSMASVHAESAHKSRTWKLDTPTRLSWRKDSAGRLDAYLGGGASVTVMPVPERWAFGNGYVAVLDRFGIGGSPRYLDAQGRDMYGTSPNIRSAVHATQAQAKAAANRHLLKLHKALAGKSVGSRLSEIERARRNPGKCRRSK